MPICLNPTARSSSTHSAGSCWRSCRRTPVSLLPNLAVALGFPLRLSPSASAAWKTKASSAPTAPKSIPASVGLPITAFIRMSIVGNVLAKLTERVHSMPEIVECHRGTGEDSFILKVNVVSVEHMKDVIDRLTPFGTTSTSLVLESLIERNVLSPRNLEWALPRKSPR